MPRRNIRPFLSYAREDAAVAKRLSADLRAIGTDPWLDVEKLVPGQEWERAIRSALREATHVVALISQASVNKRGFVQKELRFALEFLDELPPGHVFVVPVRLDGSVPAHERIRQLHWVDLFEDYSVAFRRLAEALGIAADELKRQCPMCFAWEGYPGESCEACGFQL